MADDDSEEPAITLGAGEPVEGAPLARVTERLMWGIEKSEIERRDGETLIRTPDGPRELGEILQEVERVYFGTRQEFERAVREVIGHGPVPTAGDEDGDEDSDDDGDSDDASDEDGDEDSDDDGDSDDASDEDSDDDGDSDDASDEDGDDDGDSDDNSGDGDTE